LYRQETNGTPAPCSTTTEIDNGKEGVDRRKDEKDEVGNDSIKSEETGKAETVKHKNENRDELDDDDFGFEEYKDVKLIKVGIKSEEASDV
jgi:hypothetical protein